MDEEKYLFEIEPNNDKDNAAIEKRDHFSLRIGGTYYDVTTHLKTGGTRTVLNQFKEMLLANQYV
jgi:hypothetical protein